MVKKSYSTGAVSGISCIKAEAKDLYLIKYGDLNFCSKSETLSRILNYQMINTQKLRFCHCFVKIKMKL